MAKRKAKGLQIVNGRYVKAIGYAESKSGKIQARRWYVGAVDDGPEAARQNANKIKAAWEALAATGATVWPKDANPLTDAPPSLPAPLTPTVASTLTVAQARQRYLDGIKARVDAGTVSHQYWTGEYFGTQRGVDLLGPDTPLASIGAMELERAVLGIASRPMTKPRKGQKQESKRLSVKSAKVYLSSLRAFLNAMSKTEISPGSEIPLWRKPLKFDDIFRLNKPEHSAKEKQAMITDGDAEAKAFTVEEIRTLYKGANDRQRLWICLALNCGFAPMELNTLTPSQVYGLDTAAASIQRFRNKTDIYAKWTLWDETTTLLRHFKERDKRDDPDAPMILTDDRKPLIAPRGMGRRDAVRSAWFHVVDVLPEDRQLPFKFLRKSGARLVRLMPNIGGDKIAEMYLSHSDDKSGVLKVYSGRDWEQLAVCLAELRKMIFGNWNEPIRKVKKGRGKTAYVQLEAETVGKDLQAA